MPIVRFLVSSLPLEQIIKNCEDIPSAIDYACGAGHFLTEYAVQIKDYVKKYRPSIPLNEFYAHITGIEKEYRLSKVSKVSAFMYGHDETKIIYSDALIPNDNVKEGTYDVLIANPPYSVKGFLETLTETQRKQYSLFNDNLNIAKNNAIEIFFIERAAQLLKAGGVAGIILPVSVLNKGGIYAKAREIILQQFDIVALVEFGSGTFGKTGTNTITMFLRRKETNTPDAEHYKNRVDCWFCNYEKCESNEIYDDIDLLRAYCDYCKFEWEDYHAFLAGNMTDHFLEHETIQAYHTSFFGNQRNAMKGVCEQAKEIRTKFISRQKTQAYKRLPEEEKKKQDEQKYKSSLDALKDNLLKIAELDKLLQKKNIENDQLQQKLAEVQKEKLKAQNEAIKQWNEEQKLRLMTFKNSEVYQELLQASKDETYNMTPIKHPGKWMTIQEHIDSIYPDFTDRLHKLCPTLSDRDLQVCYLTKLGMSPSDISRVLKQSRQAITNIRKRIMQKIEQITPKSSNFDHFIEEF